MLLGLARVEDQACAGRARDLDQLLDCWSGLLWPAVGDHRRDQSGQGSTANGSATEAAASRSATEPSRPDSASHTKVSRLPFGPGRPELA